MLHPNRGGTALDVTKLALTVVGGVGGGGALVIAYQQQRYHGPGRFDRLYADATSKLDAVEHSVRIAGVYAMAAAADESSGYRRQLCINALCELLRRPDHAIRSTIDHHTESLRRWSNPYREHDDDLEDIFDYRRRDTRELRATIVRVISAHLRPDAEYSWSTNDFDFCRARLEDADFSGATFSGTVWFSDATFSGTARFSDATFTDDVRFSDATFTAAAWFSDATFAAVADFSDATFSGDVWFDSVAFCSTAWFSDATFSGTARFSGAAFSGTAHFERATFAGTTWFNNASFSSVVAFDGVAFSAAATFANAYFGKWAVSFADPSRWGPPEPTFDWSEDIPLKPANVEPQDWPPVVVTPLPDSQ